MIHKIRMLALLGLVLNLPVYGQEPPQPPETPAEPQAYWPTQPRPLPFVHTLFSSNMVIQRDVADPIWGWSTPGDTITVTVEDPEGKNLGGGARATAVAGADGKWMTKIGPFAAGGPLTLTIKGATRQVVLKNVLAGDVWLCSGQSNMNWPVRLCLNGEEESKQATNPLIRSFTVSLYPSLVPMPVPPAAVWETCTPEQARNFTGLGYFFAREITRVEKIPIGLIHSSVGATAAEVWISGDGLRKYMPFDFKGQLEKLAAETGDPAADYFKELEKWAAAADVKTNDWMNMPVDKPWEENGLSNFDGLVWYRKDVVIPEPWAGKPLSLVLGQIRDKDITWFNGTLIGCTQGKGAFRRYGIEGACVKPGSNVLTVAVFNTNGPGGFGGNAKNMMLRSASDDKAIGLGGIWQARPSAAMKDIALPFPRPKLGYYKTITAMYNGMIAPLTPFAIKGALWFQGAASWPFWLQYRRLLPALIADWRDRFQVGDFPFLTVTQSTINQKQTKPVEPAYGEIREAHWRTVRKVPNTGLVVAADLGDEPVSNIHFKNKQEVGRRLALVARHLAYGEKDLVYSGPEYTEMMLELTKEQPNKDEKHYQARLYFNHVGGGLVFKPGTEKPNGFAVAGEDKKFVWADAVIEGDTVVVSSPEVAVPRCVRYGWSSNPILTLFNKEGLPAINFRTDE